MAMLAAPLAGIGGGSAMGGLGTIFSVVGMVTDFIGSQQQAKAQEQAGAYQAKVAQQNAIQQEAVGQRRALAARREGQLVASSAVAKGAKGGGSLSDPTTVKLIGDIEARGATNFYNELYSGTSQADSTRQGGQMAAYQGKLDAASTRSTAMSNLIGSGASLMAKYAPGGAPSAAGSNGGFSYVPGGGGLYKTPGNASFNSSLINWY